jgi:hypothetical protein
MNGLRLLPDRLIRESLRAAATVRTEIRHFALVTHSVPAERVRARTPSELDLETFQDETGLKRALISVGCFRNVGFRPAFLPFGGISFEQMTFRTYVRYRGRAGIFFFGTTLSKRIPYRLEHLFAQKADLGRFHINRVFDPKLGPNNGYDGYSAMVRSLERGETYFRIKAKDPPRRDHLSQSLTHRLHGFFETTLGGITADQVVSHRRMSPWSGQLLEGRFDFWERLGFLLPEEFDKTHSVLIEPSVVFRVYPPIPAWLIPPPAPLAIDRIRERGLHLLRR